MTVSLSIWRGPASDSMRIGRDQTELNGTRVRYGTVSGLRHMFGVGLDSEIFFFVPSDPRLGQERLGLPVFSTNDHSITHMVVPCFYL